MIDYDKVPWRAVHEYLLEIESATTKEELVHRVCFELGRLIHTDVGVTLFDQSGKMAYGNGFSDQAQRVFNDYYRFRIPFVPDVRRLEQVARVVQEVRWSDFCNSEFVTDFARPNRMAYNIIRYEPGFETALSLHRSAWSRAFSDADKATLEVIAPHINNLFRCQQKLERSALQPDNQEIKQRFPKISKREAEVAMLLCRGLTAGEIAFKLFISVRTVQSHIGQLYLKLNVRSKREAISRLVGNAVHHGLS
jgi:DNA-binding CsgD family transcriptional regulator